MTDRQTSTPGQYAATITAEQLLKMQNGEQFFIVLKRADNPTTEGTPYNKASVLPDDLAALICPDVVDPTPADALRALNAKAQASIDHPGCYYRTVDGEVEWINPPMADRIEYRTAERYLGKPVYTKLVNYGAIHYADEPVRVDTGIDTENCSIVSFWGHAFNSEYGSVDGFPVFSNAGVLLANAYIEGRYICVKLFTTGTYTADAAVFAIKYTKG